MKKLIVLTLISVLVFNSFSYAQTKIEKFCEVSIDPKIGFSSKSLTTISFGQEDSLFMFKNSSILAKLKKVNELKTSTDVLNYMSSLGWKLVNVIPFGLYTIHERFYFKKEFDITKLATPVN